MKTGMLVLAMLLGAGCAHESLRSPLPPIGYMFEAEPAAVEPGQSTTLHWSIPGATKVTIDAAGMNDRRELVNVGTFAATGQVDVRPAGDTTYVITCENAESVTCASVSVRVLIRK